MGSLGFAQSEEPPEDQAVNAPACIANVKEFTDCLAATEKAALDLQSIFADTADTSKTPASIQGASAALKDGSAKCAEAMAPVEQQCETVKSLCETKCGPTKEVTQCQDAVEAQGKKLEQASQQCTDTGKGFEDTNAATQAAGNPGSGFDPSSLIPALSGMMNPKKEEKKKKEDTALNPDGTLNCAKPDAYKFNGCAQKIAAKCMFNFDNSDCQKFQNIYCSDEPSDMIQNASAKPLEKGTGNSSSYCKALTAHNYCQGDVAGRSQCPSCLELSAMQTQACKDNPSLCLAQNSPEQIAANKSMCPNDPKYEDVNYVKGGSSYYSDSPVTDDNSTITVTGDGVDEDGNALPDVVLPQSVSKASVQSASRTPSNSAAFRGQVVDPGPASDVTGMQGPTLFSTASEAIQSKCLVQQFFNCPNSQ